METETAEEALVKNANRAAKVAFVCLVVALLVLAIDNRIKREIVRRGQEALGLLEEARKLAKEARDGGLIWASKPGGTADSPGEHSADGVVHAAGASASPGADARRRTRKVVDGEAGEG